MVFWSRRDDAAQPDPQASAASGVADRLRASGLVDAEWYRATYPDVAAAGVDPALHYVVTGAAEGRNPNAVFDTAWYLATNDDVRGAGLNPLLHYVASGAAEGRAAGPGFDTAYYAAQNLVTGAEINPLVHYLRSGRHDGRVAVPFDEAEAFEVGVRVKQQAVTGAATALLRGARAEHVHFALEGPGGAAPDGGLPLPPLRLAQRIGSVTLEDFESSGRDIRDTIVRVLPEDFRWRGARCLDFGSGVGRAIRHFREEAKEAELWGCDIDGPSIRWSVQNLSPPFRFVQIGEVPTLPFEDNSFDLVYAVSVLSHIHSTWHQWLVEIRRILKPGGSVFVSFLGQTPMEEMLGEPYWSRGDDFGMYVKGPHQNWNDGGPMIFVSPGWIKAFWGSLFDIDYLAMEGLMDYQSFCLMRKPAPGAPTGGDVPILRLGTSQAFDPDAVGCITQRFDLQKHFRDSYGLDLEPLPETVIEGWIVFRRDTPARMQTLVDGRPLAAQTVFEPGAPYRDWRSPLTAFAITADLRGLQSGQHLLETRIESAGGRQHRLTIPLLIR